MCLSTPTGLPVCVSLHELKISSLFHFLSSSLFFFFSCTLCFDNEQILLGGQNVRYHTQQLYYGSAEQEHYSRRPNTTEYIVATSWMGGR